MAGLGLNSGEGLKGSIFRFFLKDQIWPALSKRLDPRFTGKNSVHYTRPLCLQSNSIK